MKKYIWRSVSCLIVLAMILGGLWRLFVLTERKDSYTKYAPFYEQDANFDVLFMGTSHVRNGFFPMELWNDYGIVSYNFGGSANPLSITYWQLVNAFDYTHPQLVVIDCHKLEYDHKLREDSSLAHISLDSIPLSRNKLRALDDLFDTAGERMEFLFDFSVYHNRWEELERSDFYPAVTKGMGATSQIAVASPGSCASIDPSEKLEKNTIGVMYLEKMIQFCQERNVEVLLTYIPFPASAETLRNANRVHDIAEEYDVKYLDFETLKSQLNFSTDLYDPTHLNPSGARKITSYIGSYIMQNYTISDQRNNPSYYDWFDKYDDYMEMKANNLKKQTELKSELMLLHDKNFSYSIYLQENTSVLDDSVISSLLENIGINPSEINRQIPSMITVDNTTGTVSYTTLAESVSTSYGDMTLSNSENGRSICMNGEEQLKMAAADNIQVGVVVLNNSIRQIVATNAY